ncbi:MAG: hypothetical protein KAT07_03190, partial [Calditrichia bacterium]|nr:hypothetical protein [Calditrichia bacterium]
MNYLKKILSAHLIIIIFFLLCSCGPKHLIRDDVIYKDNDFSYNHLLSNRVIIGGIGSQEINFTNKERIKYSSLLSTILIKQLGDVQITNTLQLMYKIGQENYFSIMKEFDVEQMLMDEDMQVIRDSLPQIAYIIVAYIENESKDFKSSTDHAEGKYETVQESIYLLTVEFQIYDVFQENMVWNNIIFDEARRTGSRTDNSFVGTVIGDLFWGAFRTIDREEVLAKIYEKF